MVRVAIIDDEAHARESSELLLMRFCPEAIVVYSNTPMAFNLQNLEAAKPDLVLADLNAFAEYPTIWEHLSESFPERIVIITAVEEDEITKLARDVPYLLKPVSQNELIGLIQKTAQALGHRAL